VYPSLMSSLGLFFAGDGAETPLRTGNRHAGLAEAPYNVYPTSDGYVAIICVTDAHWRALAGLIERPELGADPAYATRRARVIRMDEIDELVSQFTSRHERDALCDLLRDHRVPCAPVRDLGEVVADPHLHERGMLQELDHPEAGRVTLLHSPLRYSDHPPMALVPSPGLGEHNEAIFCDWLGLERDDLDALIEAEVV
jgi:CoA:oxalate CoA-transferase